MKRTLNSLLAALSLGAFAAAAEPADARVFELRTYYANPGKLDALLARFRDHTVTLFEGHGMTNVGYWIPADNAENKLVYLLAYPSRDAREASWKRFMADPVWRKAYQDSIVDGKLVARVEKRFLQTTDYSPALKQVAADPARVFEIRTYTTTDGNLQNLDARFRDHTLGLFERHGMANLIYFHLMADQEGAANTLLYLLAHESQATRDAGFAGFRDDPEWKTARAASEKNAGGSLTIKDGVKSEMLLPADFSRIR